MSLKPIDFYDAKKWDITEGRELEDREHKAIASIAEAVQDRSVKKILDIGCGNGFFLSQLEEELQSSVIQYYGADYSKYMVQSAKKLHPNMYFSFCNLEDRIPFENKSLDIIYCGEVIEHIYNPDHMLEECARVLKPNGLLILTTPNLNVWYNRILFTLGAQPIFYETSTKSAKIGAGFMKRIKRQDVPVGHIRLFNKRALTDILQAEGFEVLGFKGATFHSLPKNFKKIDSLFNVRPSLASNLIVTAHKMTIKPARTKE